MIIKPSLFFEGSKTPGRNPKSGIYRATFMGLYPSQTSKGKEGFKMRWELVSNPYNTFEVTNSYSYSHASISFFYKNISDWKVDANIRVIRSMPDLSHWINHSADVRVEKFKNNVPYISKFYPPETLLAKVDDFKYTKKYDEQLELFEL